MTPCRVKLSKMTLSISTLSYHINNKNETLSILTLSRMTLGMLTLSIITLCKMTLSRTIISELSSILSVVMPNAVMLNVVAPSIDIPTEFLCHSLHFKSINISLLNLYGEEDTTTAHQMSIYRVTL